MREVMLGHKMEREIGISIDWARYCYVMLLLSHGRSWDRLCSLLTLNCGPLSCRILLPTTFCSRSATDICERVFCCYAPNSKIKAVRSSTGMHVIYTFPSAFLVAWSFAHRPTNPASLLSHALPLSCSLQWHQVHTVPVLLSILWPAVM